MQDLESNDLFFILDCTDLTEMWNHFRDRPSTCAELVELSRLPRIIQVNKRSRSCLSGISGGGNPIEIWWALISLLNLGIAAFPITCGITIITFGVGAVFFYLSYKNFKKKQQEIQNYFELAHLKFQIAQLILAEPEAVDIRELMEKGQKEEKVEWSSKVKAMGVGLTTLATLLVSYYWGISSIIEALGLLTLSHALLGPVGITLAVILVLGVSCYFGFKYYQAHKESALIQSQRGIVGKAVYQKQMACYKNQDAAVKKVSLFRSTPVDNEETSALITTLR